MCWAAFGLLCVLFQIWVLARWAADGNLHACSSGGYTMSAGMKLATRIEDAVALAGSVLLIVVAWRQSRKAGHITLSAALVTGYFLVWWTDPYSGSFHHTVSANRYDVNLVSWGPYLPGWHGPTPQTETFLENGAYPWVVFWIFMALGIAALLRRYRPRWSRARTAAATVVISLICDIPMEHAYMRFGGYGYPRALPYLTLFEGHWYQLPLTSPLCLVLLAALPVLLMTLYAGPGREAWLLEGSLSLPPRAQPWIRLLAGVGFATVCMLALQLVMLLASLVSHPIVLPSWFDLPRP
ncbi:spirocyclase AveC family protein [Kitasatospora sp. NPDC088351]|uniref:spirocyclase AveC family protein n=1 Tax=Kitasatospora sp. NPDC088351 TaxID=3155180 RepID=UPI0034475130